MSARGQRKPISKKVEVQIADLQRRRGVRELAKRFLIVCEDTKSACNYFEALKTHFNLSAASVQVAHSEGRTQPIQVVKCAIEIAAAARKPSSGSVPFDEVWCVIDGDFRDKIANARTKATANRIKLAVSTMCFEYWVLLHFEENNKSACNSKQQEHWLKKHVPAYTKGKCDFLPIVAKVRDARTRAAKLRRKEDLPEKQNPCSDVYLLIDALGLVIP